MWGEQPPHNHRPREECLMIDMIASRQEIGKFVLRAWVQQTVEQCTAKQAYRNHNQSGNERESKQRILQN